MNTGVKKIIISTVVGYLTLAGSANAGDSICDTLRLTLASLEAQYEAHSSDIDAYVDTMPPMPSSVVGASRAYSYHPDAQFEAMLKESSSINDKILLVMEAMSQYGCR